MASEEMTPVQSILAERVRSIVPQACVPGFTHDGMKNVSSSSSKTKDKKNNKNKKNTSSTNNKSSRGSDDVRQAAGEAGLWAGGGGASGVGTSFST